MTITFGSTQANAIVANNKDQLSRYGRIVHRSIYSRPPATLPDSLAGTSALPAPDLAAPTETPANTAVPALCEFCQKPARCVWGRDKVRLLCGRCFWNRLRVFMQLQEG